MIPILAMGVLGMAIASDSDSETSTSEEEARLPLRPIKTLPALYSVVYDPSNPSLGDVIYAMIRIVGVPHRFVAVRVVKDEEWNDVPVSDPGGYHDLLRENEAPPGSDKDLFALQIPGFPGDWLVTIFPDRIPGTPDDPGTVTWPIPPDRIGDSTAPDWWYTFGVGFPYGEGKIHQYRSVVPKMPELWARDKYDLAILEYIWLNIFDESGFHTAKAVRVLGSDKFQASIPIQSSRYEESTAFERARMKTPPLASDQFYSNARRISGGPMRTIPIPGGVGEYVLWIAPLHVYR